MLAPPDNSPNDPIVFPVYTVAIFQAAQAQGIALTVITPAQLTALDALPFSADVKARLTLASRRAAR